ncbi:MAG: ZIP family metal transporter [Algisphaera sp.]
MNNTALLTVYCVLVVLASVAGGLAPLMIKMTHRRLQLIISLTTGFMLGVAVLLMIPHAVEAVPAENAMLWLLAGFLLMFFIERFLSFHTHEVAELDDAGHVVTTPEDLADHAPHDHACHHDHVHPHKMAGDTPGTQMSWMGAAVGMAIHSVIDGVALAAAVSAAAPHGKTTAAFAGFAVFAVVLLHKPLDALTVISLTASGGFNRAARHLINAALAAMVPVGVLLFVMGLGTDQLGHGSTVIGYTLAFSAGTFLCIALSDLLPELQFHDHDRVKLSLVLLLGVSIAAGVSQLEHRLHNDHAGHDHNTPTATPLKPFAPPATSSNTPQHDEHAGHDHAGHDH